MFLVVMHMLIEDHIDSAHKRFFRNIGSPMNIPICAYEVGYSEFPPKYKVAIRRNVDVYILHYVISGEGEHLGNIFGKGDVYLVSPENEEKTSAGPTGFKSFWIAVKGSGVRDFFGENGMAASCDVFAFSDFQKCADIINNVLFEINPANKQEEAMLLQAAFYKVMAIHAAKAKLACSAKGVAKRVADFIRDNFKGQIEINQIAKEFGISRSCLYTTFKKEYNVSPKEYLLQERIEWSKVLLARKEIVMSVQETAFACGFTDPLYFSRVFRKKTGKTPTEFKNLDNEVLMGIIDDTQE